MRAFDPIAVVVLATALGCALMAGLFFAFSVAVMQALGALPPAQGIAAMRSINVVIVNRGFLTVFFGAGVACIVLVVMAMLGRSGVGGSGSGLRVRYRRAPKVPRCGPTTSSAGPRGITCGPSPLSPRRPASSSRSPVQRAGERIRMSKGTAMTRFAATPMQTRRTIIVATSLALLGAGAWAGDYFEKNGLALRGYDPVAYFKDNRPVQGSARHVAEYKGSVFRFASTANRDAFAAEPAQYAPQYGGFCAFGAAGGYKAATDPAAFSIVDGKLYLTTTATCRSSGAPVFRASSIRRIGSGLRSRGRARLSNDEVRGRQAVS